MSKLLTHSIHLFKMKISFASFILTLIFVEMLNYWL